MGKYRPYLFSYESYRANHPGNHVQPPNGQEGDWKQLAWIYEGTILLYQPDHLCKEMTGCKTKERVGNGVHLEFGKAFEMVSHLLTAK